VPRPFVAYLRVYEPLSAFDQSQVAALSARLTDGALARKAAGQREEELWLRSQICRPPRLLPGERADGSPAPNAPLDVLVLDPAELPEGQATAPGADPLVCPLDLRPRAAAALAGFLDTTTPALRDAALGDSGVSEEAARARTSKVMTGLDRGTVHIISATWTVPLPWFALVEPDERRLVLGESAVRELSWRTPMARARQRTARALSVTRDTMGEEGPAAVLRDTGQWLENFHPDSVVELDYGGLVQLLADDELQADSSVTDVHAIVAAMEDGDATEIATRYQKLREFWARMASHERHN
jgi:hypothetical protein